MESETKEDADILHRGLQEQRQLHDYLSPTEHLRVLVACHQLLHPLPNLLQFVIAQAVPLIVIVLRNGRLLLLAHSTPPRRNLLGCGHDERDVRSGVVVPFKLDAPVKDGAQCVVQGGVSEAVFNLRVGDIGGFANGSPAARASAEYTRETEM